MVEVPYCEENETSSKRFLKKFHELTNDLYEIKTQWIIKKMGNLSHLMSKNPQPACVIYEGICTFKESYLGETKQNVEIHGRNIQTLTKYLNYLDILKTNPTHASAWKVLMAY